MPRGDRWKPIELKLPLDLLLAVEQLARDRGVSRAECIMGQCIRLTLRLEYERRRRETDP